MREATGHYLLRWLGGTLLWGLLAAGLALGWARKMGVWQ